MTEPSVRRLLPPPMPSFTDACMVCRGRYKRLVRLYWEDASVETVAAATAVLARHVGDEHPHEIPDYDLDCPECVTYGTLLPNPVTVGLDRQHRAGHLFQPVQPGHGNPLLP